MAKELNVLKPTSSDLYPTPDERELLGVLVDEVQLRALRIGFHAGEHDCQAAYERGYATAEIDILAKTT